MAAHFSNCRRQYTYLIASLVILPVISLLAVTLTACGAQTTPPPTDTPSSTLAQFTGTPLSKTSSPSGQTARPTSATRRPMLSPTISPTPLPVSTLETTAEDLQGIMIQFWYVHRPGTDDPMRALVRKFNTTSTWGFVVLPKAYAGYGELAEEIRVNLVGGALPDLLLTYSFQGMAWDKNGRLLTQLNDYVSDPVWGLSAEEQADFYPVFWQQDVSKGKRFGLPFQRTGQMLYYNVSWAEELGYDTPPYTPSEFKSQVCAATRSNARDDLAENDGTGGWMVSPNTSTLAGWIHAFGGEIVAAEESGYQFDTLEALNAFDFLKELAIDKCAWIRTETPSGNSQAADFASRRALVFAGSVTELAEVQAAFDAVQNKDEWTVLPFPSDTAQPAIEVYGPSLMVVQSTPDHQLAAWVFARWLASPENQAEWAKINSSFPTRTTALDFMQPYAGQSPQWSAAVELLSYAHEEPRYPSWEMVRWALGDAQLQLLSPETKTSQISDLLKMLEQTAAEIHNQIR